MPPRFEPNVDSYGGCVLLLFVFSALGMARIKQSARKCPGGKQPRKQLAEQAVRAGRPRIDNYCWQCGPEMKFKSGYELKSHLSYHYRSWVWVCPLCPVGSFDAYKCSPQVLQWFYLLYFGFIA